MFLSVENWSELENKTKQKTNRKKDRERGKEKEKHKSQNEAKKIEKVRGIISHGFKPINI
jgi:hypothetical protein